MFVKFLLSPIYLKYYRYTLMATICHSWINIYLHIQFVSVTTTLVSLISAHAGVQISVAQSPMATKMSPGRLENVEK